MDTTPARRPTPRGLLTPEDAAGLMDDLEATANYIRFSERQLAKDVAEARQRGLTWDQVASAIGVSKQAAHKRFRSTRVDLVDRELPL